jgi:hypothetical protein
MVAFYESDIPFAQEGQPEKIGAASAAPARRATCSC